MKVGVVTEIKPDEYRVALTPAGARELALHGHEVLVERRAGTGSAFADADYEAAGARLLECDEVWAEAELLLKVKEPLVEEFPRIRAGQTLFTYLHLAPAPALTQALMASGATCIAYETVETDDHKLPLLAPMSEVAGRLAPQMGAMSLEKPRGGRGILLGGVPGVPPAKVVVLGGGIVGYNAALIAVGMQADVWVLERSVDRMRELDTMLGGRITLSISNRHAVEEAIVDAAPRDEGHARPDEAPRGAGRRGDRPGRLLRDVAPDDALRSGLRGRRRCPLLRGEHAGGRPDHVHEGPHERDAAVRRADRAPRRGRGDAALAPSRPRTERDGRQGRERGGRGGRRRGLYADRRGRRGRHRLAAQEVSTEFNVR
jgi:hypothetical protein